MNYLSVCSGIEAATVAWHDIGWNPVGFSEIEPFPSAVLSHHYPDVTNFGDMTKFKEWNLDPNGVDLLVGGTPCQSFSVAGLRKGLDDPRGNLALTYCSMLDHFRPTWFIWENVPGVLSSSGGRDFGSFLGAVAELGYGFAYRVLDAQYFGVAQRRRRVFVVGHLGNWQRAAAVLFERESLRRDTAPSRETREEITGSIRTGFASGSDPDLMATLCAKDNEKWGCNQWVKEGKAIIQPAYGLQGNMIGRSDNAGPQGMGVSEEVCFTLTKADQHGVAHPMPINTMVALRHEALGRGTGFGIGEPGDPAYTLTKGHSHAVAHPIAFGVGETPDTAHCLRSGASRADKHESTTYIAQPMVLMDQGGSVMNVMQDGTVGTLRRETHGHEPSVVQGMAVRRLTPVECERLQGFPDGYTNIAWRKKDESPDGPRYKALGNSMAVPVMRWIGERINQVKEIA